MNEPSALNCFAVIISFQQKKTRNLCATARNCAKRQKSRILSVQIPIPDKPLPDKKLLKFLPDYRINLISPKEIDDTNFEKFHSKMAEALQYIKYPKDKANLERVINENPKFTHLDRRTADLSAEILRMCQS